MSCNLDFDQPAHAEMLREIGNIDARLVTIVWEDEDNTHAFVETDGGAMVVVSADEDNGRLQSIWIYNATALRALRDALSKMLVARDALLKKTEGNSDA